MGFNKVSIWRELFTRMSIVADIMFASSFVYSSDKLKIMRVLPKHADAMYDDIDTLKDDLHEAVVAATRKGMNDESN